MKTMINKFGMALMIAIFASVQLMAFEDSLKVTDTNKLELVINEVNKTTYITLKDSEQNILFEKSIDENEKYARTFNLELLPDGDYMVAIEDDTRTKIHPVSISKNVVHVVDAEATDNFKPFVNEKGSRVYVSQFAPDQTPLYVAIYNNAGELVHEETLRGKMELGKIFDFSKTHGGKYRFYLESKGMSYDHLVYIGK